MQRLFLYKHTIFNINHLIRDLLNSIVLRAEEKLNEYKSTSINNYEYLLPKWNC